MSTPSGSAPSPAPTNPLTPVGPAIKLEDARKAATAALAEARKNNWLMAVAVVDPNGTLVYFERMDDVQLASATVAQTKARSAALFKRPTKAFQDAVAGGGIGLRVFGLEGAVPVDGGVPLTQNGRLVGAIGLSGDASENDAVCAWAGARAIAGG